MNFLKDGMIRKRVCQKIASFLWVTLYTGLTFFFMIFMTPLVERLRLYSENLLYPGLFVMITALLAVSSIVINRTWIIKYISKEFVRFMEITTSLVILSYYCLFFSSYIYDCAVVFYEGCFEVLQYGAYILFAIIYIFC